MHLIGEPVTIITDAGDVYDDDGYLVDSEEEHVVIAGCVIQPKGAGADLVPDGRVSHARISVLAPVFVDVEVGSRVLVRGVEFEVSEPVFHHQSAFGSSLGGTEIPLVLKEAA